MPPKRTYTTAYPVLWCTGRKLTESDLSELARELNRALAACKFKPGLRLVPASSPTVTTLEEATTFPIVPTALERLIEEPNNRKE